MRQAERIAAGSIAIGLAVLALKTAAWWVTDSAALFSDAAESVVNVAASLAAFVALRLAARLYFSALRLAARSSSYAASLLGVVSGALSFTVVGGIAGIFGRVILALGMIGWFIGDVFFVN